MIITDSSFIYALYNLHDSHHQRAVDFAANYTGGTVIPSVILPEVGYLFMRDIGYRGVQQFLGYFKGIHAPLEPILNTDLERIHEISVKYDTSEFDFVDCCIMAISERLDITQVATFDRRDFSVFRPQHCDYLELLP